MKRSEMVKEISLNIARQATTSGNHDIDLTWLDVEKVLDRIEQLGMLPCFYDDPATGYVGHIDEMELDGYFVWEEEDAG